MLFEFSDYQPLEGFNRKELEKFLYRIWEERYFAYEEYVDDLAGGDPDWKWQPFLRFDGNTYSTRNFTGFIHFEGRTIEIYPKVFRKAGLSKELILGHIFYWFSHCRKLYFPVMDVPLDKQFAQSLPELLVWHFAKYCQELIAVQPFSRYEQVEEALATPKGRIDFNAFIRNGLVNARPYEIDCMHEPFVYDNTLNRGIKLVCRMLLNTTSILETQHLLQQIVFQLDEVEDHPCTSAELARVFLNPLFEGYKPIIEWCKRILDQQLYSANNADSMQWALLFPMEYVFEDFVAGFLEAHFSEWFEIYPQRSELYLSSNPKAFNMKHDILLIRRDTGEKVIIDTKYKLRDGLNRNDKKQGIDQADMYQMVSYAYRRGCSNVILLYPNSNENLKNDCSFKVESGFNDKVITISAYEIPFWNSLNETKIKGDLETVLRRVLGVTLDINKK